MHRSLPIVTVMLLLVALPCLADDAVFAGMTLGELSEAQQAEMQAAYGEPAGVVVKKIVTGSMADKTGVLPGDVLISVREANETDYYPIPPAIAEMIGYAARTQPDPTMRLLVLRKVNGTWYHLYGLLGQPFGVEVPDGVLTGEPGQVGEQVAASPTVGEAVAAVGRRLPGCSFTSTDPTAVLATAPSGDALTQQDVDIYAGLLAWAFGTTLTQGQKAIAQDALVQFWQMAPAEGIRFFAEGVRAIPNLLPTLSDADRESLRQNYAQIFMQTAQTAPQLPLAQVIMQVAGSNQQVLAGAGTGMELTVQDVNAMLEYVIFQTQMTTGEPVYLTQEQYNQFAQQIIDRYNNGTPEEKQTLSQMDIQWGMLRNQWAQASARQQMAAAQQWQQQYQQQYQDSPIPSYYQNDPAYMAGYQQMDQWAQQRAAERAASGQSGGSGMTPGMMNIMQNMIDMDHQTSMTIINNMGSGPTTDVYDSGGAWLYSY